jgi:uncharacterized pyridoxamine 5'-phosphate oxidase family protein
MDATDLQRELDDPVARRLLEEHAMVHLAYNGPDGFPRVIPAGFWWNGKEVVVCTATTAPKVRALAERPEVALAFDSGDTPGGATALQIRGTASIDIVDGVAEEYLAMTTKGMAETLGPDGIAEFEANVRKMYEQMARIRITPTWARVYDYGAGRMPKFLKELAERNLQQD